MTMDPRRDLPKPDFSDLTNTDRNEVPSSPHRIEAIHAEAKRGYPREYVPQRNVRRNLMPAFNEVEGRENENNRPITNRPGR